MKLLFSDILGAKELKYMKNSLAEKHPELVAEFLNYGYTEEGHMLYNFGIENISYVMEDGYPRYTELITNNPDGLTMQYAMSQYMASAYGLASIATNSCVIFATGLGNL